MVQTLYSYVPPLLELAEQSRRATQSVRVPGHTLGTAVLAFRDEPGTFQDRHVFLDGGKRHVVVGGELTHRRVGVHDPLQDVATRGVGECPEELVQAARRGLSIYNHLVVDHSTDLQARLTADTTS